MIRTACSPGRAARSYARFFRLARSSRGFPPYFGRRGRVQLSFGSPLVNRAILTIDANDLIPKPGRKQKKAPAARKRKPTVGAFPRSREYQQTRDPGSPFSDHSAGNPSAMKYRPDIVFASDPLRGINAWSCFLSLKLFRTFSGGSRRA